MLDLMPRGFHGRNVNNVLFPALIAFSDPRCYRTIAPRGKLTRELLGPVITTYSHPLERVLFCPIRDANPFFHFFEALWILAGQDDVQFLSEILPRIADFSDEGNVFHGAYGARMRGVSVTEPGGMYAERIDQLGCVIGQLRDDPASRRAVVAIWQPEPDAGYAGKDMPCNCTIAFKVRDGKLNMTVFNRSNDMLLGAYGANVVQFSTIQEYIAAMLHVDVGAYHQFSDSFHIYEDEPAWKRMDRNMYFQVNPYTYPPEAYRHLLGLDAALGIELDNTPVEPFALVTAGAEPAFDTEVQHFINRARSCLVYRAQLFPLRKHGYANVYLDRVATPLLNAFIVHTLGDTRSAIGHAGDCEARDWALAAQLWLARRLNKQGRA